MGQKFIFYTDLCMKLTCVLGNFQITLKHLFCVFWGSGILYMCVKAQALQLQQMTGQVDVMCSCSLMMGERLKK
jgi:hypothetical protein